MNSPDADVVTFPLPKGVSVHNGRYYLIRKEQGKTKRYPLSRVEVGMPALHAAIQRIPAAPDAPVTVEHLLREYMRHGMDELAASTRAEYTRAITADLIPWAGHMLAKDLKLQDVAMFLEAGRKGGRGPMVNRERAMLSSAYNYGMRNGLVDHNPTGSRGELKRNTEHRSEVYVTDEQLIEALERAPEASEILMDALYLSGIRLKDLVSLKKSQITVKGIEYTESKTKHLRLKKWSPAWRAVVDRACARSPESEFIFTSGRGLPWTRDALQSARKRLNLDFTWKQLRAKAQTDSNGKNVLGHSGQMLQRYTRREELEPTL